jgi:Family of unknown function (DUF6049)
MQSVRTVVRTLTAVFLASAGLVLAASAVRAHAQEIQQSFRTDAAASHQLTISIDGVTPNYATPTSTVKVTGTLTNHTGSAIAGIAVQLLTSRAPFGTRFDMNSFASGASGYVVEAVGTPAAPSEPLANGATVRWTISFSPAEASYSSFGAYPLEVQASSTTSGYVATGRTFLPFWPDSGRPESLDASWIWPLIDQPQQGACGQTLATNSLAGSLSSSGRLGTLLATGARWARQDHLTWAVDPALLSDASVMTGKYSTGGNAVCVHRTSEPASTAAATWLDSLRAGTAGDEMFLTPYADADVSALTHAGLDATLKMAYQVGESVAGKILPDAFGTNGTGTGGGGAPSIAWPADGTADKSVLTSLADNGGINTVVLNSGELPSTDPPYDNALGSTTTTAGTQMNVLLADSQLTSVLGSASAGSSAAAQFAAAQDFLAETAMIAAEAPNEKRALVIAPPQRWDPSAAEAEKLLSLTSQAPWLDKTGLSSLATAASQLTVRESLPRDQVAAAELGDGYLDQVGTVSTSAALYKDLLYKPSAGVLQSIDAAVAATTSAAWRGADSAGGWLALTQLADYLSDHEQGSQGVRIITGKKVLLAGTSGQTPVSVTNLGQQPIRVQVTVAPGNGLSVGNFSPFLTVQPGQSGTVKIPLNSTAIGTTTMQLQLETENGSPLAWTAESLSVQVTRYGRALLVLIAAALGVLVLTSAARWIRRRLNDGGADGRAGGTG